MTRVIKKGRKKGCSCWFVSSIFSIFSFFLFFGFSEVFFSAPLTRSRSLFEFPIPSFFLFFFFFFSFFFFLLRTGVQAALRTLPEASVTLDAVFQAKVDKFLLDATKESYHQGEKF